MAWQRRGEEGQALVVFVLFLFVLMGIVALVVDGGYAYAQRRRMQYAADAAALAGVRLQAMHAPDVVIDHEIARFARENGADTYSWTRVNNRTLRVRVSHRFPTFFAAVVGLNHMTATAVSEASASGVRAIGHLLPIAVREFPFEFGRVYTLWAPHHHTPGNFGWLDWNDWWSSTPELAFNICHPENSGVWRVGQWVPGATGIHASIQVRTCLNRWLNRPATIVVYDQVTGVGHHTRYHIVGFARFVITDYRLCGCSGKYIRGRFERYVGIAGEGGGPNYGLITVTLGPNE